MVTMKRKLTISVLFIILMANVRAQVASDTLGCVPLAVNFKSPNPAINNPVWDFNDGASSDKLNPSHTFTQPGTYTVTLKSGTQQVASIRIRVLPEIQPQIAVDTNQGCAPLRIKFTDKSIVPAGLMVTGYLWDFGDGVSSQLKNPSHTYEIIGSFDVGFNILTSIPQCNVSKIFEDQVVIADQQNVLFGIDSISPTCIFPTRLYLTNYGTLDSTFTYKWDFGNGTYSNKAQPDPITYQQPNDYTIVLVVDNNKGCRSSISSTVSVRFYPPFMIDIPDTVCYKAKTSFINNTAAADFEWSFGAQADPKISTDRTPSVVFNSKGFHDIHVRQKTNLGCERDTTYRVFVEEADATFTITPDTACSLPATFSCEALVKSYKEYLWDGIVAGAYYSESVQSVGRDSFYYNEPDSVAVQLGVTSKNGCFSKSTQKYYVLLPNAQFEVNAFEGEAPFLLRVTDKSKSVSPIIKWIFTWGDGTSTEYDATTIGDAFHEYDFPGDYYVNLAIITENGCMDKYFGATIHVHKKPVFQSGNCSVSLPDPVICLNDSLVISILGVPDEIDAVNLSIGNTITGCEKTSFFTYSGGEEPGIYPIIMTLENGGQFYEFTDNITIKGARAHIKYQVSCTDRLKVFFENKSKNATDFYWEIMGEKIRQDSFYYTFPGKGDYKVSLTAENQADNCAAHTESVTISLREPIADIQTDLKWCAGVDYKLISTHCKDAVIGCKSGYLWSFPKEIGFPNIVTDRDTVKAKLPPGKHTITLEVRDVNGCRDTAYAVVDVYGLNAGFTSDRDSLCRPVTATFTDISEHDLPIISYQWSFDTTKNSPVTSHTFTNLQESGSAWVVLKVVDSLGCKSEKNKEFTVYSPSVKLSYEPLICEGQNIVLTATDVKPVDSDFDYLWKVDEQAVPGGNGLTIPLPSPGQHTIDLKIVERGTNCVTDNQVVVRVTAKPNAVISGITDSVFCYPKTLQLTGENSVIDSFDTVKYSWDLGNGQRSLVTNPVATYNKGKYTISLMVKSDLGCSDMVQKEVTLVGPEGRLIADKEKVCKGELITFTVSDLKDVSSYYWDFGQGETAQNVSPFSYAYNYVPESGNTFASVVLRSAETGCETVLTAPVGIYQVIADFPEATTCDGAVQVLNRSTGADQQTWSYNGAILSTQTNPLISFGNPGSYKVDLFIVNTESGCRDTVSRTLTFLQKPTLLAPASINLCGPETYKIVASPGVTYTFNPAVNAVISGDSIVIKADQNSILAITATSQNGCTATTNINIRHTDLVVVDTVLVADRCMINAPVTLDLTLTEGDTIFWLDINGTTPEPGVLSCLNCSNPVVSPEYIGTLTAYISNYEACGRKTISFEVKNTRAEIPNVFSPNNDGYNDVFRPIRPGFDQDKQPTLLNMTIFDRWGKQVYSSDKPWDGTMGGKQAPSEVYLYKVTYRVDSCTVSYRGDVTLLR